MVPQIRTDREEESGLPCSAAQARQDQLRLALREIDVQVAALRAALDRALAQYELVREELRLQGLL